MESLVAQRTRKLRPAALGALGIVLFLALWQLAPALGVVNPEYFPNATDTITQLVKDVGTAALWKDIGATLVAWGLGLLIATVAAVIFGTIIGLVPFLRRATHTTVEFLRPIPSVALIPLAILLFGLRLQASLLIIVYASFWQVFVQVLYGVADVDTVARDTAKSFGLSRSQRFRSLVLPTALPYIMTGIRLAAAVALILTITAQMFIGTPGIGRSIIFAQQGGNWVQVYALIVVTGALGLLVNIGFRAIERRTLKWHESVRGEEVL